MFADVCTRSALTLQNHSGCVNTVQAESGPRICSLQLGDFIPRTKQFVRHVLLSLIFSTGRCGTVAGLVFNRLLFESFCKRTTTGKKTVRKLHLVPLLTRCEQGRVGGARNSDDY